MVKAIDIWEYLPKLEAELAEARAQIAAKDAALLKIADGKEIRLDTGETVVVDRDDASEIARAALARASTGDEVMADLELTVVPRDLYYHEVAYVRGIEAELAEARAQIAAKDAEIAHLDKVLRQVGSTGMDPTKADELEQAREQIAEQEAELKLLFQGDAAQIAEIDRLEAQIAAKDAALRAIRIHTIAIHVYDETSLMIKEIDKALATPTRETDK